MKMEILSTGEKIRRARIMKGCTLKDICKDRISVSKLSCIEKGKMPAKIKELEFIAQELDLPLEYLVQTEEEQLENVIRELEGIEDPDRKIELLETNLLYAEENGLKSCAFRLGHLLFNNYIQKDEKDRIQRMIPRYYELWKKSGLKEGDLIFCRDMAGFLFSAGEYGQAAGYYRSLGKVSKKHRKLDAVAYAASCEAACHMKLGKYEQAYDAAVSLKEIVDRMKAGLEKAEAYKMLAMLSLRKANDKFAWYERKAYEFYDENLEYKAEAMYDFASIMFDVAMKENATEYVKNALVLYPAKSQQDHAEFMLKCIEELVENDVHEPAKEKCDQALNLAIKTGNLRHLEKAYYLKARVLEREGDSGSAEIYYNLSLDTLLKFGTNSDLQKKYMQVGEMYHRMGNTQEALRNLDFAIKMERRI
ncbi:MAG: Tetratricopeptide 2 repeat protein [Firmicutes bacterium]|nr:Tetratricopeptide 2 repeat protein [Bacillota bacterium]